MQLAFIYMFISNFTECRSNMAIRIASNWREGLRHTRTVSNILGLGLRLNGHRRLHQQGIIVIRPVNVGQDREVNPVRNHSAQQHDTPRDRHGLPAPRPATVALVLHEGNHRQGRGVGPGSDCPAFVSIPQCIKEQSLELSDLKGE